MTFWQSNCAILGKQYPGLLEEICRENTPAVESAETLAPEDLVIETAASGAPALRVKGLHVHSARDPEREGRRLVQTITAGTQGKNGLLIILGFALGYTAEAAAELMGERPLIIVEKYRELLRKALELRDLRKVLARNNVVFVCGGSGEGLTAALSLFEERGTEQSVPLVIRNPSLVKLDEEWYAAAEGRIRTWVMRDDVNMATLKRFGKRWVRNLSRNISAIRDLPGISRLAGIAEDKITAKTNGISAEGAEALPVFLAAAGPGLDKTAPFLESIHRRCLVVAVDTSLRFLLKHGVEPDFVLVVDPQFWNSRHLDRCTGTKTRLIAESAVYPTILRLPFREKYLCGSLFPLGSFIEKRVDPKGNLGAGGSVATTAWDFARILGAKDIWIAGLDLAFPGLKTHFRGALFEEKSLSESGRRHPAETWLVRALRDGLPFLAPAACGGQVLTDQRLSLYAAWFENRFSQYPAIRNHSLSAAGLAIKGLVTSTDRNEEHSPLENSAIETLLGLPERRQEIDRRLEMICSQLQADFFAPDESRQRAVRYENAVSILLRGLEHIKDAAERGAETAGQALKRNPGPGERDTILAALDQAAGAIVRSEVKEVAGFLFPPSKLAEMNTTGINPFRTYLASSAEFYRSLAEAVTFHLSEMVEDQSKTLNSQY